MRNRERAREGVCVFITAGPSTKLFAWGISKGPGDAGILHSCAPTHNFPHVHRILSHDTIVTLRSPQCRAWH